VALLYLVHAAGIVNQATLRGWSMVLSMDLAWGAVVTSAGCLVGVIARKAAT
jgi:uncharacterized membrane protein